MMTDREFPIDDFKSMRETARLLNVEIALPTFAMAVGLPIFSILIIIAGFTGAMPLWLAMPVLGYLGYCHFIYMHEAMHHNILPGHDKLKWLEDVFGWVGATFLITSYPQLKNTHLLHHSHLNGPGDPDATMARGTFKQFVFGSLVGFVLNIVPPSLRGRIAGAEKLAQFRGFISERDWIIHDAVGWLQLALCIFAIYAGYFWEWFFLWYGAGRLGMVFLNLVIVWSPHSPFEQESQLGGTRFFFGPGVTLLMWWNNLHLIHHLFPRIPFYRYPSFYVRHRTQLMAAGARIEGLRVGSAPVAEVGRPFQAKSSETG